jgi:hypothetical protein
MNDSRPGLEQLLTQRGVGICIKNQDQVIQFQNNLCVNSCGERCGQRCEDGCMKLFKRLEHFTADSEGVQLFKDESIDGAYYDVVVINDGEFLTTLLYPLSKKYNEKIQYLEKVGLTERELEIARLAMRGKTNAEMCERLNITKPTLRTHLNNIYKKVPDGQDIFSR